MLAANPVNGRAVLTVGDLVGVKPGGNPHRWYSPSDVSRVIDQITTDYKRLAPKDAALVHDDEDLKLLSGLGRHPRSPLGIRRWRDPAG